MILDKKCCLDDNNEKSTGSKLKLYIPILISFILLSTTVLWGDIDKMGQLVLFYAAYFIVARKALWKAVTGIPKRGIFNEHFLMSIATIGSFFIGAYSEGVAVMLFYEIGEVIQNAAVNRAKKFGSVSKCMMPLFRDKKA
jgi:Cd2+/Zn2+-exporting ATPase